MDRRSFGKLLIGGIAAQAAVRTWPFRVYSFSSAPVYTLFGQPANIPLIRGIMGLPPGVYDALYESRGWGTSYDVVDGNLVQTGSSTMFMIGGKYTSVPDSPLIIAAKRMYSIHTQKESL